MACRLHISNFRSWCLHAILAS